MTTKPIRSIATPALRILVVDDQPSECSLLSHAFAGIGRPVELHTAGGMVEAWACLEALHAGAGLPVIALIDIHLVLHSGIDLLAAMRDDPRFTGVPVLMMTVDDVELGNPRHTQLGALAVLRKPEGFAGYRSMATLVVEHTDRMRRR